MAHLPRGLRSEMADTRQPFTSGEDEHMTNPPFEPVLRDGAATIDLERDPGPPESAAAMLGPEDAPGERPSGEDGVIAPAPPPAHDALIEGIRRLEEHVTAQTGRLMQAFSEKLAFDGFKEEQIARLHAELQQHREGLLERTTRPLLNAVIRVHDNLGKVVSSLRTRPPEEITPERTFRVLDGFREDLELLLSQHGVESFDPHDDVFDPRIHTVLRTVPTDDPSRIGRIAERVRPGFSLGDALLQKARVAVFTAQSAPKPASQPAESTGSPANGGEG